MKTSERSTQEIIILALSAASAISIAPFVVFRILQQDMLIAMVDFAAVIVMSAVFAYVWNTHRTQRAGQMLAIICLLTLVATLGIKGAGQIVWFYPTVIAVFFLVAPRIALLLNILALLIGSSLISSQLTLISGLQLYLSGGATLVFGYVFAYKTRAQHQQLLAMATSDPLTGAQNRRSLQEKLQQLVALRQRGHNEPASLILLDVDNFKRVNDQHGHITGDHLLKALVKEVTSRIRQTDSLYRIGGEEFVVVVENSDRQSAFALAEDLRTAIVNNGQLAQFGATISLGVAELSVNEAGTDWLGRADAAMYKAKRAGRNQSFLAV